MKVNQVVLNLKVSSAVLASVQVSEVTNVSNLIDGAAVSLSMGVVVGTGSLAAFNQIA